MQNSTFRILGIPTLILLILFLLQFNWDETDYIVLGIILVIVVAAIELITKKAGKYKIYAIAAIVITALWLYVELAVGLFTNWGS